MGRLPPALRPSVLCHGEPRAAGHLPGDAGLILADSYGAELVREAPEHRLHAATRKSVTLAFARAAAMRLQALADPEGRSGREI